MHTLDYTYRLNGAYKQDKLKKWYDWGDLEEKPGSGSEGRFLTWKRNLYSRNWSVEKHLGWVKVFGF